MILSRRTPTNKKFADLEFATNGTVVDFGTSGLVDREITINNVDNLTIRGTLNYGSFVRNWSRLQVSDPLYSRIPSGQDIWVGTPSMISSLGKYSDIYHNGYVTSFLPTLPPAELCAGDMTLTVARSQGWSDSGSAAANNTSLKYSNAEFDVFDTLQASQEMYVMGQLTAPSSTLFRKVNAGNSGLSTLTITSASSNNLPANVKYFAFNMPEFLTQPGYYWICRDEAYPTYGKIYLNVPTGIGDPNRVQFYLTGGVTNNPAITLNNCNNCTFENFHLVNRRGRGILASNCNNLTIRSSGFKNIGNTAISVVGNNFTAEKVNFKNLGAHGIKLTTGDRTNLVSGNSLITKCNFEECGRLVNNYGYAIGLYGIGTTVSKTTVKNSAGCAVIFGGNDCIIDSCTFDNTSYYTNDVGAVYCGRNPTLLGNIVQNTTFRNNRTTAQTALVAGLGNSSCGVYMDDGSCGILVSGCTFKNMDTGIRGNGGKNLLVQNTFFDNCTVASLLDNGLDPISGYARRSTMIPGSAYSVNIQLSQAATGSPTLLTVFPVTGTFRSGDAIWFNGNTQFIVTSTVSLSATGIPVYLNVPTTTTNVASGSVGGQEGDFYLYWRVQEVNGTSNLWTNKYQALATYLVGPDNYRLPTGHAVSGCNFNAVSSGIVFASSYDRLYKTYRDSFNVDRSLIVN